MDNKDTLVLMRSQDYMFVERLAQLEEKIKISHEDQIEIKRDIDILQTQIQESLHKLNSVIELQQTYKPTIDSFSQVLSAGVVIRWMIIFVIGTLAAIGTLSTALEVIKKWIH